MRKHLVVGIVVGAVSIAQGAIVYDPPAPKQDCAGQTGNNFGPCDTRSRAVEIQSSGDSGGASSGNGDSGHSH